MHDDPTSSPVDGPTQWPLRHFEELLVELVDIARVTKGKLDFRIDLTPYNPDAAAADTGSRQSDEIHSE